MFLFLSIDEVFQIHELFVISDLRQYVHPSLASIWVIPYGILFVLFSCRFVPFFLGLRGPISVFSLVSGGVYVTGAIAIEALNSWLVRTGQISRNGFYYEAISGFENYSRCSNNNIFVRSFVGVAVSKWSLVYVFTKYP